MINANLNFETIASIARKAKGNDENGCRSEFIRLVEMAEMTN